MSSPVDSQFFRMLLEEEGNNLRELLDAEEYLVPQPNMFPRIHGGSGLIGPQSNGPSRHQSYRVSEEELAQGCLRVIRVVRMAVNSCLLIAIFYLANHKVANS